MFFYYSIMLKRVKVLIKVTLTFISVSIFFKCVLFGWILPHWAPCYFCRLQIHRDPDHAKVVTECKWRIISLSWCLSAFMLCETACLTVTANTCISLPRVQVKKSTFTVFWSCHENMCSGTVVWFVTYTLSMFSVVRWQVCGVEFCAHCTMTHPAISLESCHWDWLSTKLRLPFV